MRIVLWVVGVVVAGFVILAAVGMNSPSLQERGSARRAIELCWSEQSRKSMSPDEQRFIAGACEGMERKFEAKYNARP